VAECEACEKILNADGEYFDGKWIRPDYSDLDPSEKDMAEAHHAEIAALRERAERAEMRLVHLVNHCEQVTIAPNAKCETITEARAAREGVK